VRQGLTILAAHRSSLEPQFRRLKSNPKDWSPDVADDADYGATCLRGTLSIIGASDGLRKCMPAGHGQIVNEQEDAD
jgi:hypothetical protein